MSSNESTSCDDTGGNFKRETKVCGVCGDKALGYNFNAITCESCKAFFRRNALKDKEFKCPFNKKCEITTVTRRFCQLCRLIKCFEIGMKKEYIMSDEDKKEKRRKMENNRATGKGMKKRPIEETQEITDDNTKQLKYEDETLDQKAPDIHFVSAQNAGHFNVIGEVDKVTIKSKKNDININMLNQASSSNKTYVKKHSSPGRLSDSSDSTVIDSFPSPGIPEPLSPTSSAVTGSRTCDVFPKNDNKYSTNHSGSAEILNISKNIENTEHKKNKLKMTLFQDQAGSEGRYLEEQKKLQQKNQILLSFLHKKEMANYTDGQQSTSKSKDFEYTDEGELSRLDEDVVPAYSVSESNDSDDTPTPLLSSLINNSATSHTEHESKYGGFRVDLAEEVLKDITRIPTLSSSIESILSEAIKLEYEAYSSMNPRVNNRELNDAERAKLNELIVANKALLAPLDDDIKALVGEDSSFKSLPVNWPMLVDVLNLTAIAIRRLIKMSKKINAFKNMCQEDQVALLKGGCTEMMILRSAMTYDQDRDSWSIPHSQENLRNIKVDVLKEAGGKVFEEHRRFLQTFDPRWRNDENIMLILSAITLFTPDRQRVVHYDVIKLEQNSYYYLLRRYLENTYPGCEARSAFLKLIQKISELHRLNEDHVRVYLDVNPRDIEPLLIEIFDLKPR